MKHGKVFIDQIVWTSFERVSFNWVNESSNHE